MNTLNTQQWELLKLNPFKHTPEAMGYRVGDLFTYVNSKSVVCIGSISSKFNVQTQKDELYFNHVDMEFFVKNVNVQRVYK